MQEQGVGGDSADRRAEQLLLVDDNPTNLHVLFETLNGRGYRLLVARDGEQALRIAGSVNPDLVLLDIMMPGMDGFEVCRRLKGDDSTRDCAVIFLSALDDTANKVKGLALGAVDYITKPFQSKEVIARVETHLRIRRLERALALRAEQLEAANQKILAAVGEGIFGLDRDGRTTFVNPAAARLTGWTEAELLGQDVFSLTLHSRADGSPYPREDCPLHDTLRTGISHEVAEDVLWRQDGVCFPVEYTSTPLSGEAGIGGAVLAFRDITERKRAEQALRHALTELGALKEKLQLENTYLQEQIESEHNFRDIVGQSTALKELLRQAEQVAPTDSTVLVQGESGTGKEAIARAIHDLSPRSERPLIKVNCGAIAPGLVESELFGHEKGAFTGAVKQRIGHFELADGGTIFLDEVGELSLDAQVKLLRVLQEQEFERVGSGRTIRVDVRVVAATNRDLMAMVDEGDFRLDLFYRLSVFPLRVPPLRERLSDVPLLVNSFLASLSRKIGKVLQSIDADSLQRLMNYDWPGNIRELQNVIERAAILATTPVVSVDQALIPQRAGTGAAAVPAASPPAGLCSLADNESRHILHVLDACNWVVDGRQGAARILDVPASTLRSRMKKLGISRPGRA